MYVYMNIAREHEDLKRGGGSWITPICKREGEKKECANYRRVNFLSIPRKVYGRDIIERVMKSTENEVGNEQGDFRRGWGMLIRYSYRE